MRSSAPIREQVGEGWTPEWTRWLQNVFAALSGWNKSLTTTAAIDFGSVAAQSQLASSTIALTGVRAGDAVSVYPAANVAGLIFTASVTADNTITAYANNITAGAINPASQSFRIIVLQN